MDEQTIRERAQGHGQAVVDGDLNRAGRDLTKEAMAQASDVMKRLPRPATGADVKEVRQEADEFVATIIYSGENDSTAVESRWAERDGDPKITRLMVL